MKAKNSVLIILVSVPVIFMKPYSQLPVINNSTHKIERRQSQFNCRTMCADPKDITPDNPCGNCQKSRCKYEGCVLNTPSKPQWKPDDCTICECRMGKKLCYREKCKKLECFGHPVVKHNGKCCKECNFNAPDSSCNMIPVKWKKPPLRQDTKQTCTKIPVHGCDKPFMNRFHRWYSCEPIQDLVSMRLIPGCEHMDFKYYDVVQCDQKEVTKNQQYVPTIKKRPACIPV